MKKAIATYGVQRYLIDGFPTTLDELNEFKEQLSMHVNFQTYLHINTSESKMRESGREAYKGIKNIVEESIQMIVQKYLKES